MTRKLWIDGDWTDSSGSETRKLENPATGEVVDEAVEANADDVGRAVEAADRAFSDGRWSGLTPGERSEAIYRLAELLDREGDELARIESEDTGKPYPSTSKDGDVDFSVDNLKFFAAAARSWAGTAAGRFMKNRTSMLQRSPVGVVGQIAPWNYPLNMGVWKIGPALAAGCTIVLKPAPTTPRTTLMMAELSKEAGIPDGVLNVVTGGTEAGEALVDHPLVRMISLTGSSNTGKRVMERAAAGLKRVHLELGGKAPLIVFEDADLGVLAGAATVGATYNAGQDCTAATRVYAERSKYDETLDALVESMKTVTVGEPLEDAAMGPLISGEQRDRVAGFVERAKRDGARVVLGGGTPEGRDRGYFFSPTVLVDADQRSEIVQDEVFGPVIVVIPFEGEAEGLRLGNDVRYGLAASVWTGDIGRAMRVSEQLEFGTVWINDHMPIASEFPHGGFKQSGFGKDMSEEAVLDYTVSKHIVISHG